MVDTPERSIDVRRGTEGTREAGTNGHRRGMMLVLSSPSGAGKSTLTRLLLEKENNLVLSVSVTTRPRRSSEIEGVHYFFVPPARFEQMRDRGELLEWAEVHGNFYGSPRDFVEEQLAAGRDVIFDIDIQGTFQLFEQMRDDVVAVFVLPPSIAEMWARLRRRAEDDEMNIRKRMRTAVNEMQHWTAYDYVIVNDDLDDAFDAVRSILKAERHRRGRVVGIRTLIERMVRDLEREVDAG